MTKFIPPGFNQGQVRQGLLKAMGFGEANRTSDVATFYKITQTVPTDVQADDEGVPFDPEAGRTSPGPTVNRQSITVPCAVSER